MSVVDETLLSSDQRSLPLRVRPDLIISESIFQGETSWIVKDPVGMKYFRLRGPEYEALKMLQSKQGYQQIKRHLQDKFPDYKIELRQVQALINSMHSSGLLLSSAPDQAAPLQKRHAKELKKKVLGLASSIVAIKFPGFDPERFLSWLYPKVRVLFSNFAFVIYFLLCAAAITLVLTNLDEFYARLPDFSKFFGLNNLVFMGFVLILTKSIHELGHGLTCKHYGGECHEIGFMLMVLTPAMYCNTSDSWILPNKWHRIAIGAAGMWVEVVLASIATFVWWYTNPGWLHYFCLNTIFLCGVSTILFNANPLLRYDGYYMLSDYLEIPNLSQVSKTAMINKLRTLCLGMKPVNERLMPTRNQLVFAIYSAAAFVYRWFILIVIFWFLAEVFEPYGLQIIGHVAITISLIGMVVVPMFRLCKFFAFPGRLREVKKFRAVVSAVIVLAALWAVCFVPVPHFVWANFVVQPNDAQKVYVQYPGVLQQLHVHEGDHVVAGQQLATLSNPELEIDVLNLETELAKLNADLEAYRAVDVDPIRAAQLIQETGVTIAGVERKIKIRREQMQSLTLVADRNGVVMPPPNIPEMPDADALQLASWSGTPLESENESASLPRETLFCYIGQPQRMQAVLVFEQSDAKFLSAGQEATLQLNAYRGKSITGEVYRVSHEELTRLPRELSKTNGGELAATPMANGNERPLLKSFEASVAIDSEDIKLLPGMHGVAKVRVGSSSVGSRLWRQLQTMIKFR